MFGELRADQVCAALACSLRWLRLGLLGRWLSSLRFVHRGRLMRRCMVLRVGFGSLRTVFWRCAVLCWCRLARWLRRGSLQRVTLHGCGCSCGRNTRNRSSRDRSARFEPLDALKQSLGCGIEIRAGQTHDGDIEVDTRVGSLAHVDNCGAEHLECPSYLRWPKQLRSLVSSRLFTFGQMTYIGVHRDQENAAQVLQ